MSTFDPTKPHPVLIFRAALVAALYRHAPPNHTLKAILRGLFPDRGGRASADHFLRGRRTLSEPMWLAFKARAAAWHAVPDQLKAEIEAKWAASHKPRRLPDREARTELWADVLARWETMVDQLAMELISADQFKAELRRVLGRQGDRRKRL